MPDRNLAAMHRRTADRFGPRAALRFKSLGVYHDVSWDEYRDYEGTKHRICVHVQSGRLIDVTKERGPWDSVLRSEKGAPELPHWHDGLRECIARMGLPSA